MKRLFLILALALALLGTSSLWAATPGTCTQTVTDLPDSNNYAPTKVLVYVCVASVDAATFPAKTLPTDETARILGYDITECRTYPGAVSATSLTSTGTNPTALYDVAITDEGGLSLITITDAAAATPASDIPALKAGVYGGRTILGAPVFAITGNAVNSANVVVRCILRR